MRGENPMKFGFSQGISRMRAPYSAAIAGVRSVEPVSAITISPTHARTLSRQRRRVAASLRTIIESAIGGIPLSWLRSDKAVKIRGQAAQELFCTLPGKFCRRNPFYPSDLGLPVLFSCKPEAIGSGIP